MRWQSAIIVSLVVPLGLNGLAGHVQSDHPGGGYVPHGPIIFDDSSDFGVRAACAPNLANGVVSGCGTPERPWIISGWLFAGAAAAVYSLHFIATTDYVVVRDNWFEPVYGIGIDSARNVRIEWNEFHGSRALFVEDDSAPSLPVGRIVFANNRVVPSPQLPITYTEGVRIESEWGSPTVQDVTIANNYFEGAAVSAIEASDVAFLAIIDNWIVGGTNGIVCRNSQGSCSYVTISGNRVEATTNIGISGVWGGSTITGNSLVDNARGLTGGVCSGTAGGLIRSNNIQGNREYGVRITSCPADVTSNWWGAPTGPSGIGTGTGDSLLTTLASPPTFEPWSAVAFAPRSIGPAGDSPSMSPAEILPPFDPIKPVEFRSNSDFGSGCRPNYQKGVVDGCGTINDPWIIRGWAFTPQTPGGRVILIQGTTAHVLLQANQFDRGYVEIEQAKFVRLESNLFFGLDSGSSFGGVLVSRGEAVGLSFNKFRDDASVQVLDSQFVTLLRNDFLRSSGLFVDCSFRDWYPACPWDSNIVTPSRRISFIENTVEGGDFGVYVNPLHMDATPQSTELVVRGNLFRNVYAAVTPSDSVGAVIEANRFQGGHGGVLSYGGGRPIIRANIFEDLGWLGVHAHGAATITGNLFRNANLGVRATFYGSAVQISGNDFIGNRYAAVHADVASLVDARNNWWGDESGPAGIGPGSGDKLLASKNAEVTFDPWSSAHNTALEPPAVDPNAPRPGLVVSPVPEGGIVAGTTFTTVAGLPWFLVLHDRGLQFALVSDDPQLPLIRVEVLIDGVLLARDDVAPFTEAVHTAQMAGRGMHELRFVAHVSNGQVVDLVRSFNVQRAPLGYPV